MFETKTIEAKINNYNQYLTINVENLYKLEVFLNDTVHVNKAAWLLTEEILEVLEEKLDNDESIVNITDTIDLAYENKSDASSYKQLTINYSTALINGELIVNTSI